MTRTLAIALLALALTACQPRPPKPAADNPYFRIPAGTRLVLNRAVEIPPHQAAVFFQYGKRVSPNFGIDKYQPSCKFEMWNITDTARTIQPDSFSVIHVVLNQQYVDNTRPGLRYAALTVADRDDGGGPFASIENTVLYLHSQRQPHVYRLTCSEWDDFNQALPLTVNQIRDALGKVFTLNLPKG